MDANSLLNAMLSGGVRGRPPSATLSGLSSGQGGGLGAVLGGLMGGGRTAGSGGGGAVLGGLRRGGDRSGWGGGLGAMLSGLMGGGSSSGMAQGLSGSGLGGLAASLAGGSAGQTGGMGLLAGLAASLLGGLGDSDRPEPEAAVRVAEQADPSDLEGKAMLMVRAMVAAAKADGVIDAEERGKILEKLAAAGAGETERAFVAAEMEAPLDLDGLVNDVHDRMTAAEVFAASALAIDVDTDAERAYLESLADRLGLRRG